jgi:hypothetical protein
MLESLGGSRTCAFRANAACASVNRDVFTVGRWEWDCLVAASLLLELARQQIGLQREAGNDLTSGEAFHVAVH